MTKTALIGPKGYDFGKGGYASFHRVQLPGLGTIPSPAKGAPPPDDPVVNFRRGILFYFGNCEVPEPTLKGVKDAYDSLVKKKTDVDKAIEEGKKDKWGKDHQVKTISESIKKELQKVSAKAPKQFSDAANQAAAAIGNQLPDIVAGLLSEVGKLSVNVTSDLKEFGTALVGAIQKTYTYWNTRDLQDALRSGEPVVIVAALRKELGKDAIAELGKTLYNGAKIVASALTAGAAEVVTKVVDTVVAFLAYIWQLYKKVRDYFALRIFFKECNHKFKAADTEATSYRAWLSGWISELPIIASHCIASPMCGSYFGFLSTLADESALKGSYGKFQSLKDPARDYVKGYAFEFSSKDPMVKTSLQVIQKGGVDLTDGAAAQSLGWFRRTYMKYGSKVGLTKNTLYG